MAGPWEKYQAVTPSPSGPWTKYQGSSAGAMATADPLAATAAGMVSPAVDVPTDTSPAGYVKRLFNASKEMFIPSMENVKRLFSPSAGQFGVSKVLEEEGRRVGGAVRSAAENTAEQIATSKFGQQNPNLSAGMGAAYSTVADVASDSLTPSAFQQQLGGEGLGIAAKASGLGKALKGAAVEPGRRALGFQKSQLNSTKSPFEANRKLAQANRATETMLERGDIPTLGSPDKAQKNALGLLAEGKREAGDALNLVDEIAGVKPTSTSATGTSGAPGATGRQSRALPGAIEKYLGSPREIYPESVKGLEAADKLLPDLPSYDTRITRTPKYVKAKIEAAETLTKYAAERKVQPTSEFYEGLFREMHDEAVNAAMAGPEAQKAFLAKFPSFDADFPKLSNLRGLRTQYAQRIGDLEKSLAQITELDFDQAFSKVINPQNDAELSAAVAARRDVSDRMVKGQISLNDLDYLRQYWGQLGFRDKTVGTAQANVYRKAWKAAGDYIKQHIGRIDPELAKSYVAGMKKQEAAMTAMKGINNKMAGEAGNMAVSFPGIVVGATRGDLPKAIAATGAFEAIKRRGAAPIANTLYKAGKSLEKAPRTGLGQFTALLARAKARKDKK